MDFLEAVVDISRAVPWLETKAVELLCVYTGRRKTDRMERDFLVILIVRIIVCCVVWMMFLLRHHQHFRDMHHYEREREKKEIIRHETRAKPNTKSESVAQRRVISALGLLDIN